MKKWLFLLCLITFVTGCSLSKDYYEEPPYNHIASHVNVIDKASSFVVYEYFDIRVDEIVPVAAIYCHDQGGKQASLYDITLWQNNRRRATFICK